MKQETTLPVGQREVVQDFRNVKLLGVQVGKAAPDFAAKTIDGHDLRLSELRGKVVLIDFWATWCGPCVAELPNVAKAYEQYKDQGLVIVSISFDKDADTARKFMESKQIVWPQVWAEGADKGPLAQLYGVAGIPATFLVDREGRVIGKDLRGEKLLEAIATQFQQKGRHW